MDDSLQRLVDRVTDLEARNAKLEQQTAWMKRVGAFAVLAVTSVCVLMGAADSGVVEAKRFVVKDDSGNVRAFMDAAQGHGRIWLYDESNVTRVFIGASQTQPGFQVNGATNKAQIKILAENGTPYIATYDANGKETFKKP
jgi:hypothetical protein